MHQDVKRIQIFDIAKGISIILMIISRFSFVSLYPYLSAFQDAVMVFKMPSFVFISGYLLSDRLRFRPFLESKIDGLLKPLLSFVLSLTILEIIFYVFTADVVTLRGAIGYPTNLLRSFYHGSFDVINVSFWFIGALFLGQLSLKGFLEIRRLKKPLNYIFLVVFFMGVILLDTLKIKFYWTEYIPSFFLYLSLGYGFKQLSTRYFNGTKFFYSNKTVVFPILFLAALFVYPKLNLSTSLDLSGLLFNYHYTLVLSLLGIFTLLFVCRFIEKVPVLSAALVYCSKASFFILAYHIFILQIFTHFFDMETYNPILHTSLVVLNLAMCCLIYKLVRQIKIIRVFFYPLKTLVLNYCEVKIVNSKYLKRFFPAEDTVMN
ncbi:hypothetical protein FFWV33_12770 [Flavobacterium faecale]|uniref:Acyltransferase 3 domain-containing protein n=1 Tax=Flavobacterium faecale TaxID=1355330 RepID=A0A2S1LEX5_9FLAO|nr:acyltransferase family protein [Flavobacterium faecale]AWG22332.1 hypothetical protein FFWV33_12770 [Flavobacterium faecale]